jgi:hypothetical protein
VTEKPGAPPAICPHCLNNLTEPHTAPIRMLVSRPTRPIKKTPTIGGFLAQLTVVTFVPVAIGSIFIVFAVIIGIVFFAVCNAIK